MSLLLLFARLLLSAVFLVAGLAKLADLAGSRQANGSDGLARGDSQNKFVLKLVRYCVGCRR